MKTKSFGLVIVALLFRVPSFAQVENINLKVIQEAILKNNASWTAGENWVTKLTPAERRRLCGTIIDPARYQGEKILRLPRVKSLPTHFDWRNNSGNWVTGVRNQGNCGSCWDFSGMAQIEAWWKIHNARLDSMPDLSEQFVMSCNETGGCDGDNPETVLNIAMQTGIPPEVCFPYRASHTVSCSEMCSDWQSKVTTIPGWGYITLEEDIIDNIKAALLQHPVSASYTVYSDFMSYQSGIYEHITGGEEGGHAILIVGWDDTERYWICKNSWGPDWGESGYFRIRWGQCGMGTYMPFIYDALLTAPSLSVNPTTIDVNLTVGDSSIVPVTVTNNGSGDLHFAVVDQQAIFAFHCADFNAYEGESWWCGDPDLGGYADHWLQYLESPVIDLSQSVSPRLTFQVKYAVEDPAGSIAPYDGWDGCNVWISTDGGQNYQVIQPVTPVYNCQNLWSFGHPEEGWNLGQNIAGWGGNSNGWKAADFDLTNYKSSQVKIRWAFASDMGYATDDDPNLTGFFVDNIRITSGGSPVFTNDGVDNGEMTTIGFGSAPATWIGLSNSGGKIVPQNNAIFDVKFVSRGMEPGDYHANLLFISNDLSADGFSIPCAMHLQAPQHDLAVVDFWTPGASFPILVPGTFGATLRNCGKSTETDFKVACVVSDGPQVIFCDTVAAETLAPGEELVVQFDELIITNAGQYAVELKIIDLSNDYNLYNNVVHAQLSATNFLEGFESPNADWTLEGGWGLTNKPDRHSGQLAVHCNGGVTPYLNDMSAKLTFTEGLRLNSIQHATLKFWAIYAIQENEDFCYFQASSDSNTWTTLLCLTGVQRSWKQIAVSLDDYCGPTHPKTWVRWCFVSGAAVTNVGIVIDDVFIYPEALTGIAGEGYLTKIPDSFQLEQNYPNPFNPVTKINYHVPISTRVTIKIFNYNGQLVKMLIDAPHQPGIYTVSWEAKDLPSGIYFYQINAADYSATKKCLLMK